MFACGTIQYNTIQNQPQARKTDCEGSPSAAHGSPAPAKHPLNPSSFPTTQPTNQPSTNLQPALHPALQPSTQQNAGAQIGLRQLAICGSRLTGAGPALARALTPLGALPRLTALCLTSARLGDEVIEYY